MKIQELLEKLAQLQQRGAAGEDVSAEVAQARADLEQIKESAGRGGGNGDIKDAIREVLRESRSGSRFPSPYASDAVLDTLRRFL